MDISSDNKTLDTKNKHTSITQERRNNVCLIHDSDKDINSFVDDALTLSVGGQSFTVTICTIDIIIPVKIGHLYFPYIFQTTVSVIAYGH